MNLGEAKTRIRSLVDDPRGTWAKDDFLEPLINQKYEEIYNKMLSTGVEFERRVVELPSVAAGVKDLSAYALSGKDLELMLQPVYFEYKQVGTDPTAYLPSALVDRVGDVIPGQFIQNWEWRSGIIYFTPSALAMDIRIRGDFLFGALTQDADAITATKNLGHAVAYGTAALVAVVRGNAAWTVAYTTLQDNALDDIMQYMVRKDQKKIRVVGRMSRRLRSRNVFIG